ncbi:MAG TPA: phosphoribosyltransferase family protein [Gemmatimonadales bacterium]|nr:phosphoribosyltransferase family protein [Gemmatimonadales bacterium]
MSLPPFRDRHDAGRRLADALARRAPLHAPVILALPRGGVPVGWEVARALGAPLDVMVVRKLGVPGHEELAMGAIASGGIRVVSDEVVQALAIPARVLADTAVLEEDELLRQERAFRGDRPATRLAGRTVVLVDDGLATGSTMLAAVAAARAASAARVVVAVPVAPGDTCRTLSERADEVVCLSTPARFRAVGDWYEDFSQVDDDEVRRLLGMGAEPRG